MEMDELKKKPSIHYTAPHHFSIAAHCISYLCALLSSEEKQKRKERKQDRNVEYSWVSGASAAFHNFFSFNSNGKR